MCVMCRRSIELDVTKKKQSYRRSTKGGLNFGKRSTKRSRKSQNNGQSGKKSSTTIANFFKMSLGDLMGKMLVSMPHFVRCIKPNSKLNPNLFERDFVQRQLRYTGVLDTCRIRQAGYPVRLSFPAFMARYGHLAVRYDWMANNVMDANACKLVLEKLELKSYAIGLQKVFLRFYHNETLCHKLEHFLSAVLVCQKNARRFLAQADYLRRLEQKNVANLLSMSLQMQDDLAVALSTQCEQDDAEHRRLEEEEKRRKEEEEQRRLAEEAEKKRLAEEAEKKRLAEEAEKKRLAEEAERKRLAEEEERKRLAEEEERKLREEEERKQREEEERKQREEEERKRREEEELERQQQGADAAERTCLEKATKDSSDEVFCELEAPLASDAAKENADEDSAAREKAEEGDMFDEELEHRPSSTSSERQRPISQSHVSDSMDEDCIENEKPREVSGHPKSPLSDTSEELPMRSRRSGVAGWRQDELDDEYIPKRIRDRETFSSSQVQLAARNALLQKRLRRSSELPDSALVSHRTRSGSCQVRGAVVNRAESFESTGSAPSPGYTSRGKSFPFDDLPPPSGGIAAQNSSSFGSGLSLNATSTSKSPKSRSSFAGLIDMAQEKKKSKNKSPTWASSSRTAKHLMRNESVRSNPSGQSKDDDSKLRQDSLDFKYSTRVRASSCASGEMRSTFFFGNDSNKSSVDEDVVSISSMTRGDTLPFIEAKPDQVCDSLILSCESLCISAPSVDTMSILTVDTDEESNSALSNVRRTLVHGVEWPSISNGAVSSVTSLGVDTDEECNNQLGVSRVKTSSSSSPRLKSPLVESTGKLTQINILAPSPEVEALKREDSLARSCSSEALDTDEECNIVQPRLVLPSSSKFITSDAEDDHRMSQGAVFGGDSDDEAPVRDFDKTKKRRSGADLSGKSISDEWRKLAKFANNQDSRRAMLGEKGHPDEAKDAKQSKKSRHDTLSQERERLQAEVNELVKLRDEMLLNRKISEYAKAKEEATQLQTEAEAMRSEVEQMRLDVEDDMVRASTIKECARKELMLVLAMSDLLTLKPRAVLKSVSLRHNKLASERQAPEKSPSISLCVQNSAPNSARNSWTSERNGLLGMETGSVPDLSALSLPGNVGRPGHRYSTGNISLTTRRTSPLGTKVSLAETAIHAVRQMKTRKEEAPTPKQPESVSRKFISILDQTDKESIKVAEHILLSADGSSVHKAMKSVANGSLVTSSSLANTRGEESVAPEFVPPATSVPDTRGHGAMRSSSLRKLGRQRYVQDKRQAQKPNVPSNLTTVAASMSASTPSVASAPVETAIGSLTSTSSYLDGRASCQASLGCGSTAAEATADVSAGVVRRSSFAHGQASNVAQECRKEIATCTRSGSIDSQQIQAASNAKPLTSPVRKLVSETTQGSVSTLFSSAHTGLAAGVDPSPESIVTNTADKKPSACSVGSGSLSIGESLDDMIMQSNSCAAGVDSQFSFVGPAQSLHTPTASMSSVCSLHRSLGVTASLVGDLVSDNCTLSGPNSLTSPVSVADLESETLETEQQGIAATPAQSPEPQPTAAQPEPKAETDSKCEQDTPVEVSTSELSTSEPRSELSRFISLSASNLTSPMIARVQCQLSSSRSLGLMPASGEGEDGQRGKRRAASARIRRRSGGNLGTPTSRVRSVVRQIERGSSSSLDQTVVHTELDQFPIPRPDSSPVEERISMSRGESTEEECTDVDVEEAAEMFVDDPWCRISCMEMSYVNGVYSVFGSRLTIDGSLRQTACRLGLNSLPVAGGLTCVEEIRKYIGKGVVLDYRPDGCLYATKLTQNNVVVKGWNSPVSNCLPKSLVNRKGKLEHNIPTKIYDSALFRKHMISLINMKPVDQKMGLSICKVALAFVHDQKNPMHTPCWIVVDIIPRHHDVSAIMELHPDALAARSNDPWSAAKIIDPLMEFASHTDLSGIHRASWPMGESITDDPMFQTLGELPGSFPSSTNHLRLQPLPHNMDYLDGSTACATSKPSIETIPVHLSQDSGIPDEKHPESSSARAPNPMVEYDKISQSDSLISQAISTGGIKMSRSLTSAAVSCSSSTNVAGLFITAAASAESDDKPAPDGKAKRSFNTIVAELTSLQAATSVGLSSSSCGVAPSHSKTHAANTTTPLLSSIKQRNSKMKSNAWTRLALKTKTIKS
ncbi:protein split ends-like [Sycon ciliatum]|uniref:protein split ends-like n=1 Tax=Sycon ciliatum TaxID=27933 RepID=UPI0031F70D7C